MKVIDPPNELRRLDGSDLKIYHKTSLTATRKHAMQLQIFAGIDFLVRNIWRYVNKIARVRLRNELEPFTPP